MRVLPLATTFESGDVEGPALALKCLRAALATGVVLRNPNATHREVARKSIHSRAHLDVATNAAITSVILGAKCAASIDRSVTVDAVSKAAFAASMATVGGPKRRDRALNEILRDCDGPFEAGQFTPIRVGVTFRLAQESQAEGNTSFLALGGPWAFWARWYNAILAGQPLAWDLQERVSLLPDDIWRAGPEAVSESIARIEAEFDLRQRIAEYESDQVLAEQKRLGMGGNHPPEAIDDPEIRQQTLIIWDSVKLLKDEVNAVEPDAEHVAGIIERLSAAVKIILAWVGAKADLIVDTTIKWAVPTTGGYFVLNPEQVDALLRAARAWLPFIGQ